MYACIYELWKNCRGRTGRVGKSKVLQEVLADLKKKTKYGQHPPQTESRQALHLQFLAQINLQATHAQS